MPSDNTSDLFILWVCQTRILLQREKQKGLPNLLVPHASCTLTEFLCHPHSNVLVPCSFTKKSTKMYLIMLNEFITCFEYPILLYITKFLSLKSVLPHQCNFYSPTAETVTLQTCDNTTSTTEPKPQLLLL